MLEEMQSVALLGLLVCQYYLIRGCFRINETIPVAGGTISGKIDRTADLLDEVAQLIADFSDNITPPAVAQPPGGLGDLVATFLNNRMNTAGNHATTSEEWEVLPPNDDPTPKPEEQGVEPHEHG